MKAFFRITFFILFCGLMLCLQSFTSVFYVSSQNEGVEIDKSKFVERHNYYRRKVGVPPVTWSDELASYADLWASRLALKCALQHRKKNKYGENIYMHSRTSKEYDVVDLWASEEKYFNHKNPIYIKGEGKKSGHYSQIIWAKTTKIGAAVRTCKDGGQIWVCNYDPPGNYIGRKAY